MIRSNCKSVNPYPFYGLYFIQSFFIFASISFSAHPLSINIEVSYLNRLYYSHSLSTNLFPSDFISLLPLIAKINKCPQLRFMLHMCVLPTPIAHRPPPVTTPIGSPIYKLYLVNYCHTKWRAAMRVASSSRPVVQLRLFKFYVLQQLEAKRNELPGVSFGRVVSNAKLFAGCDFFTVYD